MLYLVQLLVLTLQLLLVDPVTFYLHHGAFVEYMEDGAVDLWAKVMVIFEDLELARGVSVEWAGQWERSGLEGLDILMRVPVYHAEDKRVFSVLTLDVLGRLHCTAWEMNVERDVVDPVVQLVAFRDLHSWAIIFPSSPLVSIRPFISWSSSAICSWW